jgi:hypothetical protein
LPLFVGDVAAGSGSLPLPDAFADLCFEWWLGASGTAGTWAWVLTAVAGAVAVSVAGASTTVGVAAGGCRFRTRRCVGAAVAALVAARRRDGDVALDLEAYVVGRCGFSLRSRREAAGRARTTRSGSSSRVGEPNGMKRAAARSIVCGNGITSAPTEIVGSGTQTRRITPIVWARESSTARPA